MQTTTFALISLFILAFGAISGRIKKTPITAPMIFVLFGFLAGDAGLGLIHISAEHPLVHGIAEITLVLVLFTDAARIDLKLLRLEHKIPVRLLTIGLPLSIGLGTLLVLPLLTDLTLWEAIVLAVILAPTDAALGQAVVSAKQVPVRIRQALNVESGLNDGFALPILLFFVCLAVGPDHNSGNWLLFIGKQLIFGLLGGVVVGWLGSRLLDWGRRTESISESFQDLSALGLSVFAFASAEMIGGNGFIAAFCAGLTLGNTARPVCSCLYEFAEAEGQLLTLLTFMFFGAAMLPDSLHHLSWQVFAYAGLSLTLVRLLPTWLAGLGLGLKGSTTFFLGWFGPRGIASILYALLVLEENEIAGRELIFQVTMVTVLLSVFVHGATAWPGVKWYAASVGTEGLEEHVKVTEMPLRHKS